MVTSGQVRNKYYNKTQRDRYNENLSSEKYEVTWGKINTQVKTLNPYITSGSYFCFNT